MSGLKLLIDTNIFIGLEDHKQIAIDSAELDRKCREHGIRIFIHEAARRDVARDTDIQRRSISISKLAKFEELAGVQSPSRAELEAKYGPIRKPNDEVDVALLHALDVGAVDFLVTEDQGIHGRVKLSHLAKQVFTVLEALSWLRQAFEPTQVFLPFVEERKAHQIDVNDAIFDTLREDYPDFDRWWRESCVKAHRPCWTVIIDGELAGIIVRKQETHAQAQTDHLGPKILKVCTFKVKPKFWGSKLGELLLKQALWFAQKNAYDLIYLTTYPAQTLLIQLIEFYGFSRTQTKPDGELVFEKPLSRDRLTADRATDLFALDRVNYPRFVARAPAKMFCVPIQGAYHQKLFPEIAIASPLPLFPGQARLVMPSGRDDRLPGNTIRKVYLCRANINTIVPGDLLLFYMSQSPGLAASQCVTSIGVAESLNVTGDFEVLMRLTAKRSVFSEAELRRWVDGRRVKVIDFLLAGHIEPPIPLSDLISMGVFSGHPPQSICTLPGERFEHIRGRISLGFQL